MNQFLYTAGLQEGKDCISSAVSLGDFVYISAQAGEGKGIEEQSITALKKMVNVLSDMTIEIRHVVKFTVYLTDMKNRDAFLSVYKTLVEAPFPAMTILEVQGLENNALVAVEGFAINTVRYEKSCCSDCSSCSEDCSC